MISNARQNSLHPWMLLSALMLALGFTACSNTKHHHERPTSTPPIKVALGGSAEFFQGQLEAVATLDSVSRQAQAPREDGGARSSGKGGRPEGGRSRPEGGSGQQGSYGRNNTGSQQPPLVLKLVFTNHGSDPVKFAIREVDSPLGSFAARPELATLAPNESLELEPMISRMGVISGSIPLRLELRAHEQTETQTLTLNERFSER